MPSGNQLVVSPERAVEEQHVGLGQTGEQRGVEIAAAGHERADLTARLLPEHESHRVPFLVAAREIGAGRPATGNASTERPLAEPSR